VRVWSRVGWKAPQRLKSERSGLYVKSPKEDTMTRKSPIITAAAAAVILGAGAIPASAATIYTDLAAFGGAYESGIPLTSHCGTAGCHFSVSDGHGGVVWYGIPTLPPPPPSSFPTTAALVGYFVSALEWTSTHVEQGTAVLDVIVALPDPPKTIEWQIITGGTVPCQPAVCNGESEVQQVENVTVSR
jgi:hypothetical protein